MVRETKAGKGAWRKLLSVTLSFALAFSMLTVSMAVGQIDEAYADNPTPITVYVDATGIYANGQAITLVAGSSDPTKTAIKGANGEYVTYSAINGATIPVGFEATSAGIDLSAYSIYGGAYNTDVSSTSITFNGGKVKNIYGGGCENTGGVNGDINIRINGGTITDAVYSGGYNGTVTGNIDIRINGGTITGAVYGGGCNGNVNGDTRVDFVTGNVQSCFGGGYHGNISGNTVVNISGGTINNVYGGGSQDGAEVSGSTEVNITGGNIKGVYGGGHQGSVCSGTAVNVMGGSIEWDLYGGGGANEGVVTGGTIVNLSSGSVGYSIYGAGERATVTGDVNVSITGGTVGNSVYGGGRNNTGNVVGNTTLNISGGTIKKSAYGRGGNDSATVSGASNINISGGNILENVDKANSVTITGGSILGTVRNITPKNAADATGEVVYKLTVNLKDNATNAINSTVSAIYGLDYYGLKDVKTDATNGQIGIYITSGAIVKSVTAHEGTYIADNSPTGYSAGANGNYILSLEVSPEVVDFNSLAEPYSQPGTEIITITSRRTSGTITLNQPTSTDYAIGTLTPTDLAASQSASFTIQPKADLSVGTHDEVIQISVGGNPVASLTAKFTVTGAPPTPPVITGGSSGSTKHYSLSFDTNGGNNMASVSGKSGSVTDLTLSKYIPTREGYDFKGWYLEEGLKNKVTSIKHTADTTVYAAWGKMAETDVTEPEQDADNPFVDVKRDHWFYDDVIYVYNLDLMKGVYGNLFDPDGSTNRAMITTILWRMEGCPDVTGSSGFTDVSDDQYYTKAITWGRQNGIVKGYSDTYFGWERLITREELATVFYRYEVYKSHDTSASAELGTFTDGNGVSSYAQDAMKWSVGTGVMKGDTQNLLLPQQSATRAQLAAMVHRLPVNN